MQAVFEKLWVLETTIVGGELTETFADLLTLDAQLALAEQQLAAQDGPNETGQEVPHYRRREAVSTFLRDWKPSWERTYAERPCGTLPIDQQNSGHSRTQGLNMQHLVRVTGHKLNPELLRWLRSDNWTKVRHNDNNSSLSYRTKLYRLHDRLSEQEIDMLVIDFMAGTAKQTLAERYGINIKSVKKLLRERGVRRKSRWDRAA